MKNKISKILGIGISAGLVFGLIGALFAAPVAADVMKWSTVNTPDWGDLVIYPGTDIIDYDIGGDGNVIYAILEVGCDTGAVTGTAYDDGCAETMPYYRLVKSADGGVTWSDLTNSVFNAASIPDCDDEAFDALWFVSVAPDNEDWVAVVGRTDDAPGPPGIMGSVWVVASQDGGDNFSFAGEVSDGNEDLFWVFDLDVSMEIDDIYNIAVAGIDIDGGGSREGSVFRLQAGTWLSGSWVDTGDDYLGWDTDCKFVLDVEFSPNFDIDDTIVCLGMTAGPDMSNYYRKEGQALLQSGIWEGGGGTWNDEAGFPGSKIIDADGETIYTGAYKRQMGIALPADYDGSDPGARAIYLYVNGAMMPSGVLGGWVMRSDNYSLSPPLSPPGDPVLASIAVHGDADTGRLMIGEMMELDDNDDDGTPFGTFDDVFRDGCSWDDYCGGVSVWHTEEIDPCCVQWEAACKDPSGPYMAIVMYTPDGGKAYATTSGSFDMEQDGNAPDNGDGHCGDLVDGELYNHGCGSNNFMYDAGTPLDESAFSVSLDNGVSFNQIGLIDTDIDYLSDVAVCPDCSTIYISSISNPWEDCAGCGEGYSDCDSVWRSYDEGDTWERVFHGDWANDQYDNLILRLPCDAIENCCDQDPVAPSGTIYLGIQGTDQIFYSRDCGQCWNNPPATKVTVEDMAVESENIVYVVDRDGHVSKSTQYGRRWSDAVDTEIGSGHSITACCDEGFVIVGGQDGGKVAWSDDGAETFTLTDALPSAAYGRVHVACDPTCENIIYAGVDEGGIYRTDLTDGAWTGISALDLHFTGIAVANEGTLYAAFERVYADPDPTGTPCDTTFSEEGGNGDGFWTTGVARNLDPCETDCCGTETWDYLICGLDADDCEHGYFGISPTSLRICGCLSVDSNTILWAIDEDHYQMAADCSDECDPYPNGALWYYEDCAAKMGPTLTSPANDSVLDCEPCAGCDAANFTLKWERMCEACSYDVQIMDEDGNLIVEWVDIEITGDPPTLFIDGTMDDTEYALECGMTYTWHVREANTSCECVHSPWSETWSFTIAVGAADAIQLLAPEKGAMGTPIENLGFSWTGVRNADAYSFVLSPNANLTSALVSQEMGMTAFNFAGPLDYGKAYYWQVIAWQDGIRLTTSAIGVFNTMAEPEEPPPPVVVEEQPAPVINIPPAQQITPTWIYVIIGVGCALAVVVIVLIVRTRRP